MTQPLTLNDAISGFAPPGSGIWVMVLLLAAITTTILLSRTVAPVDVPLSIPGRRTPPTRPSEG